MSNATTVSEYDGIAKAIHLVESDIGSMTQASTLPGQSYWTNTYYYDSESGRLKEQSYLLETDPDYFTTLDIPIVEGRNFDECAVHHGVQDEIETRESLMRKVGSINDCGKFGAPSS